MKKVKPCLSGIAFFVAMWIVEIQSYSPARIKRGHKRQYKHSTRTLY
jgi:hypothetical protein